MQKALESIFGPEVMGLVGLVLMGIMIGPKFLTRWRGFRARQRGPVDGRNRVTGQRQIHIERQHDAEALEDHADHGQALAIYQANRFNILLEAFLWILPLLLVLIFVPAGLHSVHTMLLVMTIPMAILGLITLSHLWDRVTFYTTGMTMRLKLRKKSFDYNSICSHSVRKSLFFWMNPSFIMHMDDDAILVLDGSYLIQGEKIGSALRSLDKRIKTNAMLL